MIVCMFSSIIMYVFGVSVIYVVVKVLMFVQNDRFVSRYLVMRVPSYRTIPNSTYCLRLNK